MLCEKRIQLNVNYLSVLANTTSVPSRIVTLSNATSSTQLEPWRGLLASVILAVKKSVQTMEMPKGRAPHRETPECDKNTSCSDITFCIEN